MWLCGMRANGFRPDGEAIRGAFTAGGGQRTLPSGLHNARVRALSGKQAARSRAQSMVLAVDSCCPEWTDNFCSITSTAQNRLPSPDGQTSHAHMP